MATQVEERIHMISGIDENGDTEMFMSTDRERADARYLAMRERLRDVRRNSAWEAED